MHPIFLYGGEKESNQVAGEDLGGIMFRIRPGRTDWILLNISFCSTWLRNSSGEGGGMVSGCDSFGTNRSSRGSYLIFNALPNAAFSLS